MQKKYVVLALCVILGLLAFALFSRVIERSATIPEGEQIVHAVIQAAPLSLDRRGTHMLMTGGTLFSYAESTTINLRPYEGQVVELTGTYELNIRKNDLPVLVVKAAKGNDVEMKGWKFPSLGLEIKTPKDWQTIRTGSGAEFTMDGVDSPVMTIALEPYDEEVFKRDGEFAFTLLTVDGHRAASQTEGGASFITIDRGVSQSIPRNQRLMRVVIMFAILKDAGDPSLIMDRIVRSIRLGFVSDASSSSVSGTPRSTYGGSEIPSSSGLGVGSPCGGEAGILCPGGFYCEITDRDLNIGKCVRF